MNVVIVESPAKAKTINKYLGKGYKVMASFGHVRDLPSKDGSVEPDNDFHMHWDVDSKSQKILKEITDAVKQADKLILATDPDREGEAISWHILQVLEKKKALGKDTPVERVAFNAVTKQAIQAALAKPRQIDQPLVEAYLARRALDYLVGFTLSPVLWRKLPGARSAGRVQSVALRLICDRELEIETFRTEEYWTIEVQLATAKKEEIKARLVSIAGQLLKKLDITNEARALAIKVAIKGGDYKVASVEKKAVKRNPFPPFTTSTLQQEASRKLGLSAKQTMQSAQRLYEGVDIGGETVGLITYMRTDGVEIVPEAVAEIRRQIETLYSKRFVAPFIREYKTKAKNAQEAHEAIRPTDISRHPKDVKKHLKPDEAALYELIWKRALASQMASAELEQTTAEITVPGKDGKTYGVRATGSIMQFEGFMKLYQESRDDEEDEESRLLPPLASGDRLTEKGVDASQHFTQPPPRFTEASLVKRMEELGIGRPSTYASTLAVLRDREYVTLDKKRLVPQDKGRLVIAFLESFFKRYVEYDFTADLEEQLDLISDHKLEWREVLRDFWKNFTGAIDEIKDLRVGDVMEALNEMLGPHIFPAREDGSDPRSCPQCGVGRLSLKPGRFGPFIGCSNYKEEDGGCNYRRGISPTAENPLDGKELGFDPDTGLPVTVKTGRFGTYLQLGEQKDYEDGAKPRRSSIPKGLDAATIDLEHALKLLNLPREIGQHPDGGTIVAGLGRFGPFVVHEGTENQKTYVNLTSIEDLFTIGINRAVTLIAEKKAGGGSSRFQRGKPSVLKDLGAHPDGGPVQVLSGRYGPYVTHNKVNATVPKDKDPAALTMDEAIALLEERIAKGGGKKPARKTAAKSKTAAKDKAASSTANGKAKSKPKAKTAAAKSVPKASTSKKTPAKKAAGGKAAGSKASRKATADDDAPF
ncbi:MAG: type I DNA topoisomerase [Hyphomicrobiaceae bacterium]|nr:type I DNA topoisomerase [Hyphomicrobiaceae bacterium]